MMTIVTQVKVRQGEEPAWDEAMRQRLAEAASRPGFVSCQVGIPLDAPSERVVIGTWETRAAWEAWHGDDAFVETRARLEHVDEQHAELRWHEVVLSQTAQRDPGPVI